MACQCKVTVDHLSVDEVACNHNIVIVDLSAVL